MRGLSLLAALGVVLGAAFPAQAQEHGQDRVRRGSCALAAAPGRRQEQRRQDRPAGVRRRRGHSPLEYSRCRHGSRRHPGGSAGEPARFPRQEDRRRRGAVAQGFHRPGTPDRSEDRDLQGQGRRPLPRRQQRSTRRARGGRPAPGAVDPAARLRRASPPPTARSCCFRSACRTRPRSSPHSSRWRMPTPPRIPAS